MQGPPDCPSGPRIVFGRSFGGTAFAGVGERARGGSLNAGVGLSIPLRSLITGSLAGTQVYANATLTALVKGVGAFGAVTTGRSVGYSNGTLSRHIRSEERRDGKECGSTCSSRWWPAQ